MKAEWFDATVWVVYPYENLESVVKDQCRKHDRSKQGEAVGLSMTHHDRTV